MFFEVPSLFTVTPEFSVQDVEDINFLLKELSPDAIELSGDDLVVFPASHCRFLITRHQMTIRGRVATGRIIGMATLAVYRKLVGCVGVIEDVIVHPEFRGCGIGRGMMEVLMRHATEMELRHVDLTSRPEREAANKLYRSLGFEQRNTNLYRFKIHKKV